MFDSRYCQSNYLFLRVPSEQFILVQHFGQIKNTRIYQQRYQQKKLKTFLIQNSVVTNSKEQIAENHRFMYQIICNCDLMIELKEMDIIV